MTRARLAARVLALAVALSSPFGARVSYAAPPALAESLTGKAKDAYDAGKLLYNDHDYAGAATKFRLAYDTSHDARLLWNVASCEKELRHYARAAELVDQYLKEAAPVLGADAVTRANETRAALRDFFGPVKVAVTPDGSRVLVDGEEVGTSPLARPLMIDIGPHTLRAEHAGFAPREAKFEVAGKDGASVELALVAVAAGVATLVIVPSEASATVAVDDRVVGGGRWEGPITAGGHRVKVSAQGKKAYVAEIEVVAGEKKTIDVTLENEKSGGPLWPWIVGGAALVAGGAIGGYFLLKPSDERAPAPAGKLGTVYVNARPAF